MKSASNSPTVDLRYFNIVSSQKKIKPYIASFISRNKIASIFILSIFFIFLFGIPTAIVKVPVIPYSRMIQPVFLDYFFLVSISVLLSANLVLFIGKNVTFTGNTGLFVGSYTGFLSFACPICNPILVGIFGIPFLLAFIDPLRPFFGFSAIFLLIGLAYFQNNKQFCAKSFKQEYSH